MSSCILSPKGCENDPCNVCDVATDRVILAVNGDADDVQAWVDYMTDRAREWDVQVLGGVVG